MTAPTWQPQLHPRASDGRFGTVPGQHESPPAHPHGGHTGLLVGLGAGTALAGGALVLTGTGHMGRLYRFTRHAMLDETHLDRVIAGDANLRRLAARMAAGQRREVSEWMAPGSHTQALVDHARGVQRLAGELDPDELLEYNARTAQKVGLIRSAIAASDPKDTPHLYRAMYAREAPDRFTRRDYVDENEGPMVGHGDEIDFGPFASFSSNKSTAEAFGNHIFHLKGGQAHGLRLSASYLDEWLVGGRFRVIARAHDGIDWHYHIVPVGAS